jgi:hypothetical protein
VTPTPVRASYVNASFPTSNFGTRPYFIVDGDPRQVVDLKFDNLAGIGLLRA